MYNLNFFFTLTFLLLAASVHGQEPPRDAPPSAGVDARVGEKPRAEPPDERTPFPAASANFEGIVIQARPLEVKSVSGQVRQFTVADSNPSAILPRRGDLVSLSYEPGPGGNSLVKEIKVTGTTIIGTIKEIAADLSWLIVRTRQPDKRENEVNVPLQVNVQFQALVSAMRMGDGIEATYIRDGGLDSVDGINHVKSLEWQNKHIGLGARWASLISAAVTLFVLAYIFTKGRPAELFLGTDNRYSSSKFQTLLWFSLVISAYLAIVAHRIAAAGWSYVGGVDIPQNLLILSGISVLTFTAAKAITVGKMERAGTEGTTELKAPAEAPRVRNLITDDSDRTDWETSRWWQ
ncbi:MAG: hypothetical protein H0X43_01845 [Nitrosospira sp.]|nr:hypothetical protein [Nitrosospira sp.]